MISLSSNFVKSNARALVAARSFHGGKVWVLPINKEKGVWKLNNPHPMDFDKPQELATPDRWRFVKADVFCGGIEVFKNKKIYLSSEEQGFVAVSDVNKDK